MSRGQSNMHVQVPASSANLGSGFDSIGVAIQLYLKIDVEPSEALQFEWAGNLAGLTIHPDDNLILQGMKKIFDLQKVPLLLYNLQ